MKHDDENIKRLSVVVVDGWDQETLIQFAIDKLVEAYEADKEAFDNDCKAHEDEF